MKHGISSSKLWILCVVLTLPAVVPFFAHHYYSESVWGRHATGFIQYDQAYYLANAREYFDDGSISFTYKNPNDYRADSPKIYCQIQTFVIGLLHKYTNLDPMYILVGFGWLFALLTVRVAYSLLNEFLPLNDWASHLVFVLFVWGGGLFTLAGFATFLLQHETGVSLYDYVTMYDPFQGWWFLNLGRNLIFPMESYYHFLFLLGALFFVRNQRYRALSVGLLIAWSHPFTGVEFLAIAVTWLFLERVFWQNDEVDSGSIGIAVLLLVAHIGYYQVFLTRFPAHREVHELWQLAWEYKAIEMVLGYGIVATLAAWRLRTAEKFQSFLSLPANRYLVAWFAIAFLLANHEFFMKSVQPLHFTRGYVWMPLFLIGAPTLYQMLTRAESESRFVNKLIVAGIVIILLVDNIVWLPISTSDQRHNTLHTKVDYREIMSSLNRVPVDRFVVISNAPTLSYLSTVYTPHESYAGHEMLTPQIHSRIDKIQDLLSNGVVIDDLLNENQLFVLVKSDTADGVDSFESRISRVSQAYVDAGFKVDVLAETSEYVIWKFLTLNTQHLAIFGKDRTD